MIYFPDLAHPSENLIINACNLIVQNVAKVQPNPNPI